MNSQAASALNGYPIGMNQKAENALQCTIVPVTPYQQNCSIIKLSLIHIRRCRR